VLRVILKRGKSKPFWLGHPWVYSGAVQEVVGEGSENGGPCTVIDERDNVVGWGHYNPHARIAVRLLEHRRSTDESFQTPVFSEFMAKRLREAKNSRAQLQLPRRDTNAYRLVNAEGDGLSGLIVDVYGDRAVVHLNSRAMASNVDEIAELVMKETGVRSVRTLVSAHGIKFEGIAPFNKTFGDEDDSDSVEVTEHGVRFALDLKNPQKTGFYLDQRENRQFLASYCGGKNVLDLYCHAGGFGIHALAAGAQSATFVDSSEPAIDLVGKNLSLNEFEGERHHLDAMTFLKAAKEKGRSWDVIVCDPPKFVRARNHRDDGIKKYARLNSLALSMLKPGGLLLTCSCSEHVNRDDFLRMLTEAAHRLRRSIRVHRVLGQASDHPYVSVAPQSDYLKAFLVTLS
jgi:23S rRNA (cytosine1962-C5)-methyltransferase